MSAILPFALHQNRVGIANLSLAMLHEDDTNKDCYVIHDKPVSILPRALASEQKENSSLQLEALNVYPSKDDSKGAQEKTKQLIETIRSISNYYAFQIGGNKKNIDFSYYADSSDLHVIKSGLNTYFPNAYTEKREMESFSGEYQVFDFVPRAPYFKSFTSFENLPVASINMIPEILRKISENSYGAYQIIAAPAEEIARLKIEDAMNSEWRALIGADNKVVPTQQAGIMNEKISYKSLEFHNYIVVVFRLILPKEILKENHLYQILLLEMNLLIFLTTDIIQMSKSSKCLIIKLCTTVVLS